MFDDPEYTDVAKALKTEHAVRARPRVIMDWNMNRFVSTSPDNTPSEDSEGFDIEFFPIESIVQAPRPTKGINKARVGHGLIAESYFSKAHMNAHTGRFYVADLTDNYKYWTSPYKSDSSTGALTKCKPHVMYNRTAGIKVNKIVITTENTWATASEFEIQITKTANPESWTTIVDQDDLGDGWKASGQIILRWDGSEWRDDSVYDENDIPEVSNETETIRGVRIVVTKLEGGRSKAGGVTWYRNNKTLTKTNTNGRGSYFDLIEISARREMDITDYVVNLDTTFDYADSDPLYPIGTLTTNIGSMTLSNLSENEDGTWTPGLWNRDNSDSPVYGLVDKNIEVRGWYEYLETGDHLGDDRPVSVGKPIPAFKMYTDTWTDGGEETVTVDMNDHSKFFNEITVRPMLWTNLSVPMLVWRILDSVGFVDYEYDESDLNTDHSIPAFYTDGETSVFEVLNELAKASQTAIYFDANGKLQVKTREEAFRSGTDVEVDWTFTSKDSEDKLSDIISLEKEEEYLPNHYTVSYQTTSWSPNNNGQPTLQKVWEPEGNVVLRASELQKTLGPGDTGVWISPADAKAWPYEGLVNVQGEIIRYRGKHLIYYTGGGGGIRNGAYVKDADHYKEVMQRTPAAYRHKNHFSGALRIVERGVWNSEERTHHVDASGYSTRHILSGVRRTNVTGKRYLKGKSRLQLESTKNFKYRSDILICTRGNQSDQAFFYYGTKMRFVKEAGRTIQQAGIVIHNQNANESGYFFEITPSRLLSAKDRKSRQEFIAYSRVDGKDRRLGTAAVAIGENIDYELDVQYTNVPNSSNHRLKAWINGRIVFDEVITESAKRNPPTGKFGMFTRGKTKANFEYLYAVRKPSRDLPDDFSFFDKVRSGYYGDSWMREWTFRWKEVYSRRARRWGKEWMRINESFMDDFGPYVHEIREFDVKFDPNPCLHSRVYNTNDWGSVVLDYRSDPFGAKFTIANTSRNNVVLNGEDTLSFAGTGQSVNQVLTVFGRALTVAEAETVEAKNDKEIRIRGKIEAEISSPWIQSKAMAQDIADWLKANWSAKPRRITLEVFGNPLIELGDLVNVEYDEKHINGTFVVIGITHEFDNGLTTKITLTERNEVEV